MNTNLTRRGFVASAGLALFGLAACSSSNGSSSTPSSASADTSTSANSSLNLVTEGKLTSVSDMANPPFSYYDTGSKEPKGFEVDLMAAVAEEMGLESVWLTGTKFDTIIPLIKQGGKADVAITGMTITDERKKEIDFTDSYLDSNQAIVVSKTATVTTKDELDVAGKQICAQYGTTGGDWAQENLTKATYVPLDDFVQCFTGVSTGLYDAAVCDLPVSENMITNSYTDLQISQQIATGEQYGIAVSKDNPNLTKALNEALAAIKDDGTLDNLEITWFGTTI